MKLDNNPLVKNHRQGVLFMGGCNLEHLSIILSKFLDTKHYWRLNIPCESSIDTNIKKIELDHNEANRLLEKSLSKVLTMKILNGAYDQLVIECASDSAHNFMDIDGAILPDVRSDVFGEDWKDITYDGVKYLSSIRIIRGGSECYWSLWKESFEKYYEEVLKKVLYSGKKIIFIRRYLCEYSPSDGGMDMIDNFDTHLHNFRLGRLYQYLEKFDDLTFIDPPREYMFTSEFSPWGMSHFHPEMEYYTFVGAKILNLIGLPQEVIEEFKIERKLYSAQVRICALRRLNTH